MDYLVDRIEAIRTFFEVVVLLLSVTVVAILVNGNDFTKELKRLLFVALLCVLVAVMLPSKEYLLSL